MRNEELRTKISAIIREVATDGQQCNVGIDKQEEYTKRIYDEIIFPLEDQLFSCQQLCVYNSKQQEKTIQELKAYIVHLEQKLKNN